MGSVLQLRLNPTDQDQLGRIGARMGLTPAEAVVECIHIVDALGLVLLMTSPTLKRNALAMLAERCALPQEAVAIDA